MCINVYKYKQLVDFFPLHNIITVTGAVRCYLEAHCAYVGVTKPYEHYTAHKLRIIENVTFVNVFFFFGGSQTRDSVKTL